MDRFYVHNTYRKGIQNLLRGLKKFVENLIKRPNPMHLWLAELTKVPGIGHAVDFGLFHGDEIELNIAGETAIQASIDRITPLVDLF